MRISGRVRQAVVLVAALAVGACAGSDISPVGPETETAFAKGGKGGGTGGGRDGAPGQSKKGGGGGGGGTSAYEFYVVSRVDLQFPSPGFTFDVEYPVGTTTMETAGTAAPCPTGVLPTNVANGDSISWQRVPFGSDVRCKLAGIRWQATDAGSSSILLNITLPNSWDDARQKGHFDLTFTGRQTGMASPPWSVEIYEAYTCPIVGCDPYEEFLDLNDYDVVWGSSSVTSPNSDSSTVTIRKKVPLQLPDLAQVNFVPAFLSSGPD